MDRLKNKEGGFLRLIILIVILLLLMKYFDTTFSDMWNLLKSVFGGFF